MLSNPNFLSNNKSTKDMASILSSYNTYSRDSNQKREREAGRATFTHIHVDGHYPFPSAIKQSPCKNRLVLAYTCSSSSSFLLLSLLFHLTFTTSPFLLSFTSSLSRPFSTPIIINIPYLCMYICMDGHDLSLHSLPTTFLTSPLSHTYTHPLKLSNKHAYIRA